jgi:methylthioribulose-1-phosphate dehydratase
MVYLMVSCEESLLSSVYPPPSEETPLPVVLGDCAAEVDALRQIGNEFYGKGWSVGTSSNYSVVVGRDPLRLLVTASGKDKGALQRDDFVVVDDDGHAIGSGQPKSSAETLLHVALAHDTEVGAILHTHSVWVTLLSDLYLSDGGLKLSGYEMLKGLSGVTTHEHEEWLPIFPNTQDIRQLASDVRQYNNDRPIAHAYMIHQHGLYTWGKDLAEARRHIEILEFLFECKARRVAFPGAS